MNPPTVGDLNPEIAKKFGLDADQMEMLSGEVKRWEGRIHLVTFVAAPPRADGKNDPIAYLPPGHTTYGIIDRDHRTRVNVGETWLVEAVEKIPGTRFLTPLVRLDLKNFLDLQPERLQSLASYIASKNPSLAKQLAEKLPVQSRPTSEAELEAVKKEARRLQGMLEQLTKEKASLETELGQLKAVKPGASVPVPAATGPSPTVSSMPKHERGSQAAAIAPGEIALSPEEGTLRRREVDTVESPLLVHPAYEIHFTGDLYRVLFRPTAAGVPCSQGRLVVRGLSMVDSRPAPTDYPMVWDRRAGGFLVYIGHG